MRRPALKLHPAALPGRDQMWAAMRAINSAESGAAFSVAEIMVFSTASRTGGADTTPLGEAAVAFYCDALCKGGWLAPSTSSKHAPRCLRRYILVRDTGVQRPHIDANGKPCKQYIASTQLWRAARMKKKAEFTRLDLLAVSPEVTDDNSKFLCAQWERAGYLHAAAKKRNTYTRYTLVRDTGPRPPIIGHDLSVIDGNTGELMAVAKRARGQA